MKIFRVARLTIGSILVAVLVTSSATAQDHNGAGILNDYFDLVISENYESAVQLWTEACQERSSRFDIEYTTSPFKIDCNSIIVRNSDAVRYYLSTPTRRFDELEKGKYFRFEYVVPVNGRDITTYYFTKKDRGLFWIIYPQDYYAKDWEIHESKYFRIHAHPQVAIYLNPVVLEEADYFVDRIADSLKFTTEEKALIAEKKIEFFYCNDDSTVHEITGVQTKGVTDLPSNDIISSTFPHHHEAVHLLVNIKLKRLPLMTLPFIREGIAVNFGGRWGKMSSSLMDLGIFLYQEDLVEIDSILTLEGFDMSTGADIAYPVAGIFTSYLLERLGLVKYLDLYMILSGEQNGLDSLSISAIQEKFTTALGMPDWVALMADFEKFSDVLKQKQLFASPGRLNKGKTIVKDSGWQVSQDKEWLGFEYVGIAGETLKGSFLFASDSRLKNEASNLYEQQFGSVSDYAGYRFVVRVDQNEAGLYDLGSNQLVAKYIWGITPSNEYFVADQNRISIKFKKVLVGKLIPTPQDFKTLPQ
ncbi:MAG: hypothetical protein SGI97_05865 [candidate division Zixibacteria bacterium]|nr:hypothetical protein [candidate division Zixibacteria bacterium]